jgi:hypothetical protein
LVDQTFAALLKKYAQFIAKIVLKKKFAGVCLSQDVKVSLFSNLHFHVLTIFLKLVFSQKALQENLERLRESIAAGQISRDLIEEYKKIFKNIFAKACESIKKSKYLAYWKSNQIF